MIHPRPEIAAATPAIHGGPDGEADEQTPVSNDFSASANAFGPAAAVREAILAAQPHVYPDPGSVAARRAAADRWNRPLEEIGFGAGAAEWIHTVCFAFVRAGDTVLVPGPTFGEYARAAVLSGARVLHGIAAPPTYRMDPGAIAAAVIEHRPQLTFLCTPNNPTGQIFTREELVRLADACAASGTLLVLDQSYDAFLREPLGTPALPGHPAVLVIRSLTQDHAIAGVRAGFAVGPARVLRTLHRARVPWAASTAAQAAAVAALSDEGEAHLAVTLPRLRLERELLEAAISRLRLPLVRGAIHTVLAEVGDARAVRARLLAEHALKVRDCASFGLPHHIRIAARTPEENNRLTQALEDVFSS